MNWLRRSASREMSQKTPDSPRKRKGRVTAPVKVEETVEDKADDLFLELAKDNSNANARHLSSSATGTPQRMTKASNHSPDSTPRQPQNFDAISSSPPQYPTALTHVLALPRVDQTAPPVSNQRYFCNPKEEYSSPDYGRVSAGEASASMQPFKPSYRHTQISSHTYDEPPPARPSNRNTMIYNPPPTTPSYTNDFDSAGSGTAVSTVWDEADDLKSKMQQYRSGGRRVTPNGVHLDSSGGHRPQTATTNTTSSSYGLHRQARPSSKRLASEDSAKHQLLRTALGRLDGCLDANTYRALEASVADVISASTIIDLSDATSMADDVSIMTGTTGAGSSNRRLRRKVDSLCRSLTELCIALNDSKTDNRRNTIIQSSPATDRPYSRASTRVDNSPLNYLDERRARVASSSRPASRASQYFAPTDHQSPESPRSSLAVRQALARQQNQADPPPSRPRRTSVYDGRTNTMTSSYNSPTKSGTSSDRDTIIRAPSRAATEAAPTSSYLQSRSQSTGRSHLRSKNSRDYTDRVHPLPPQMPPESMAPSLLRKTQRTNPSNISLNSAYSAATHAGQGNAQTSNAQNGAGSKFLADRLERRRMGLRAMDAAVAVDGDDRNDGTDEPSSANGMPVDNRTRSMVGSRWRIF